MIESDIEMKKKKDIDKKQHNLPSIAIPIIAFNFDGPKSR